MSRTASAVLAMCLTWAIMSLGLFWSKEYLWNNLTVSANSFLLFLALAFPLCTIPPAIVGSIVLWRFHLLKRVHSLLFIGSWVFSFWALINLNPLIVVICTLLLAAIFWSGFILAIDKEITKNEQRQTDTSPTTFPYHR